MPPAKDGTWKEDDNNKALTKEMREFVKENAALFGDEIKPGEKADFTQNGKSYKFNGQKFKDYFVGISNENQIDPHTIAPIIARVSAV